MIKKALACALLFVAIVGAHAAWISDRPTSTVTGCGSATPEPTPGASIYGGAWTPPPVPSPSVPGPSVKGFSGYLHEQDYFLGLSYGLSGAFTLYALWAFLERRRAAAAAGAAGGLTLAGLVSAGGCGLCFVTGCCGSPTLPILASFLGGTVLSFVKPLAFAVTVVSIAFGLWWLGRKSKQADVACGCGDGCCDS
ncbi:MAG: hypothetical protein M0000_03040 [Actinomycetota bacterium]|nr:hypothetical protein [Actinomycetota bacterium]